MVRVWVYLKRRGRNLRERQVLNNMFRNLGLIWWALRTYYRMVSKARWSLRKRIRSSYLCIEKFCVASTWRMTRIIMELAWLLRRRQSKTWEYTWWHLVIKCVRKTIFTPECTNLLYFFIFVSLCLTFICYTSIQVALIVSMTTKTK